MQAGCEARAPLLPAFYAGRSVLITGGTGFLGKVLVARLLATCPEVGRLHLLLRDKRGHSPHTRLADLKQSQVFDAVRASCPQQLHKLDFVTGDVTQPNLGLDACAVEQLAQVSVVFHNAATVKFWESLGDALHKNVNPVIALMDLCDQLPRLEVLVHVSTAYSNAEHAHIEERVYPAPASLGSLRGMLKAVPPPLLDEITTRLISPKPNTYVFSKAVAEATIAQRPHRHYAVAIFRPSIVVSAHRDPVPGWVDSLAGATGVLAGAGAGVLRVFRLDPAAHADFVPVDIAIDTMLAVAWETATDRPAAARVYNCTSQEQPLSWRSFSDGMLRAAHRHPYRCAVYYPHPLAIKNRFVFMAAELCLQTAPLYVADFIAGLCGVKPQPSFITVSERLRAMNRVLMFFTTREWSFSTENTRCLRERLTDKDREIYNLDIRDVDWDEHVVNYVKGIRRYLLREPDSSIPAARKRLQRLRYVHYAVLFVLTVLLLRFLMLVVHKLLVLMTALPL